MDIHRKSLIKRGFCAVLCFLVAIGVCSCGFKPKERVTAQDIINEMKDYLDEKYGYFHYDIVAFEPAGWSHFYDLLICTTSAADGTEEEFCVERFQNEDEYYYEDNYFGLVIRDDFEAMMKDYTEKYFTEYKMFSDLSDSEGDTYPSTFISFDEVITRNDEINSLQIDVFVKESSLSGEREFNKAAEAFADELEALSIKVNARIFYLSDEDFEAVTRENHFDYYSKQIAEIRKN